LLKIDHLLRNSFLETLHNIAGIMSGDYRKKIRQLVHTHLGKLKTKNKKKVMLPNKWSWYGIEPRKCIGSVIYVERLLILPFHLKTSSNLSLSQTEDDIYNLLDLTLSCKQKAGPQTSSSLINMLIRMTGKSANSDDFVLLRSAARLIAPFISDLDGFSLKLKRVSIQQFFNYPMVLMKLIANLYVTETTKIIMGVLELVKRQKLAKMFSDPQNLSQTQVETEYQVQKEKAQSKRHYFIRNLMDRFWKKKETHCIHKESFQGDLDDFPASMNESKIIVKPTISAHEGIFMARRMSMGGLEESLKALDEKANYHRIRLPRAFHGKEKFYKDYAHSDAEAVWLLNFAEEGKYKNLSLIKSFDGFYGGNDEFYMLIVAFEKLIWWSFKEDSIKWTLDVGNIEGLDYIDNEVQIMLKNNQQNIFKVKKIHLKSKDALQNVLLYEELVTLMIHTRIKGIH